MLHKKDNEQNQSILSFPEHNSSPSQISEESISNQNQLKLNAQMFVDDSVHDAQNKYQSVLMRYSFLVHYSIIFCFFFHRYYKWTKITNQKMTYRLFLVYYFYMKENFLLI